MKEKRLQTRREIKTGFKLLQAKLTRRKQRVSAAADSDILDTDVPNMGVKGTLTVLLILHVVVVGAIVIGTNYSKDLELTSTAASSKKADHSKEVDTTHLNVGLKKDFVLVGETYDSFAQRHQVDVAELKKINNSVQIHAGRYLYVPNRKIQAPVVADQPAGADEPRETASNDLAVNESAQPGAEPLLIKLPNQPGQQEIPRAIPVAEDGGRSYVVKPGDTVWRISNELKVDQAALLKINGMDDPRKLRLGMKLKIPN